MPDITPAPLSQSAPPPTEHWKPIPGFPGYEVSDLGSVRSWRARGVELPYLMHPKAYERYVRLNLWQDGAVVPQSVHRLVLAAFEGPCPSGQEVRHLDGDPTNNALSNLRYGTAAENASDKVRHGTACLTLCRRGHEFTPETTISTGGVRRCLICARDGWRRRRAAAKGARVDAE